MTYMGMHILIFDQIKENKMYTREKARDNRARRQAWRQGLVLTKSRARNWSYYNQLGYMITDANTGFLMAGEHFDLTLEDVEEYLKEE
jgi:hypothetical protein